MTQPNTIQNEPHPETDSTEPEFYINPLDELNKLVRFGITNHPVEEGVEADLYVCNKCGCRSPAEDVYATYRD